LAGLATDAEKFKAAGAEIIAISVDEREKSMELAQKLKLPFVLLSDRDHRVIDSYDVLDPGGKISRAAVFVLDRKGIVRWSYIADDYKIRPLDQVLLEQLAGIN